MIAQGTDGLSRGIMTQGVMKGGSFLEFVPLHQSALDRQGQTLHDWIESWYGCLGHIDFLEPNDWYHCGHFKPRCVWTPPPAAADAMLDQLAKVIHKRPHRMHLVLIPRLMTALWRKMLGKVCNLIFTVPLGTSFWSYLHFEPLIVGLCLPISRHKPWKLRGTPMLDRVEGMLRELPASDPEWGRNILRKLLKQSRELESMQESLVRPLLQAT
jgi:hypothetical protein